jgi:hypothetical protein
MIRRDDAVERMPRRIRLVFEVDEVSLQFGEEVT